MKQVAVPLATGLRQFMDAGRTTATRAAPGEMAPAEREVRERLRTLGYLE